MTWLSNIVNNKRVGSSVAKACWKTGGPNDEGYTQKGTKKKGDRTVPNCVPAASVAKVTDKQYNKKNAKMREDHDKPLSNQQTSGTGSARIAFAARFGGQGHSMTDKDGSPSGFAHALKRWGFSSPGEAKSFANKHKANA